MASQEEEAKDVVAFPWHIGVFDAHCHPTDTVANLQSIPQMRAKVLTVMATRAQDQELVANAADDFGISQDDLVNLDGAWRNTHKIIPAFGWHPWFSHQMFDEKDFGGADQLSVEQQIDHYGSVLVPKSEDQDFLRTLPSPRPFNHFLGQTKQYLKKYPLALVGEIGLDRSFRIPEAWLPGQVDSRNDALTPGGREGRRLSPYHVSMDHQRKVLTAQLRLAGEMQRAVSVHGVQAHGVVYETLSDTWRGHEKIVLSKKERKKQGEAARINAEAVDSFEEDNADRVPKPYPPRICLHSFSGSAEAVKPYIAPSVPCEVFFSFSTTINAWSEDTAGKVEAAVKAVPDDRVVIESDLHTAGDRMDFYLQDAVRKVCRVKGWDLEDGATKLKHNWLRFVFGQQ